MQQLSFMYKGCEALFQSLFESVNYCLGVNPSHRMLHCGTEPGEFSGHHEIMLKRGRSYAMLIRDLDIFLSFLCTRLNILMCLVGGKAHQPIYSFVAPLSPNKGRIVFRQPGFLNSIL